jgi:16S rRNA (guanine527-N7)-methyltransferase
VAAPPITGREEALAITPVSRETVERLDRFVELLCDWQERINLVASSTLPQVWTRHVADSLQLLPLAPGAKIWLDLGSGAGFPGMAIACALAEHDGEVHLVESDNRKAAFLREVAAATEVRVQVHPVRIEALAKTGAPRADVVTARALAPLPKLLEYAEPFLRPPAFGLFLKGQDAETELTAARHYWTFDAEAIPSKTDSRARILRVTSLGPRAKPKRHDRRRLES